MLFLPENLSIAFLVIPLTKRLTNGSHSSEADTTFRQGLTPVYQQPSSWIWVSGHQLWPDTAPMQSFCMNRCFP